MERLSEALERALEYAAALHEGDRRRGSAIPYVSHLFAVAWMVQQDGGSEAEVIAALLHDALEDHPDRTSAAEIERRFGSAVRAIVEFCTDTPPDWRGGPKPPWRARKEAFLARLGRGGPGWRVALADKLHNARAMLRDQRELGGALWARFHAPRDQQLWYLRAVVAAFRQASVQSPMLDELEQVVEALEAGAGA